MAKDDAADVMETCRRNARTMLASNPDAALESIEELAACVETGVARKLEIANEEISFQARIRTGMAGLLENYTCVDGNLTSTPDVSSADWNFKGINRRVHVKHDRPASQIHVIEDFISPEECLAMEQEAARTLHHATVADGKGGSRLSDNRKAMQAGITVEWETEAEGNLIAQLSRRVYDYTENVLKLGIQEHGQEDLMSIQYFGRGRNDTEPDRYTPVSVVLCCAVLCCGTSNALQQSRASLLTVFSFSSSQHCDGDCTGLPHKTGTRMATMLMYCSLPTEGGSTNFRNSAVHVKPVAGDAVFFSYMNPETKKMDVGFTEHSGCPVYEGEKKIVTQWIRYGVDAENKWDSFNTLGIKYTDAKDQ